MPRGVLMNSAQPLFSSRIGRSMAQARGSASAYSLNTTPAGGEPTRLSKLSDPTSCQLLPWRKRMNISFRKFCSRSFSGNASSMRRRPVCGLTASQIAFRAWPYSGSMCQ
jgi:hypothetical protein